MIHSIRKMKMLLGRGAYNEDSISIGKLMYKLQGVRSFAFGRPSNYTYHKWKRVWLNTDASLRPGAESNPHLVIFGMSGFGKSTLIKSLILEMHRQGKRIIVFDAHEEHSGLIRSVGGNVYDSKEVGINIMALDGMTVGQRISELTNLFRDMYKLGYIQVNKLSSCMWYCYRNVGARGFDSYVAKDPTIPDLINEINVFIKNSKSVAERNTLTHLRYRLSTLNSGPFKNESLDMGRLGSPALFLTANLPNNDARFVYMHELMQRMYHRMHSYEKEKGVKTYLFVDEAQFLIDESGNESGVLRKLIEEGRKYGFGVVMATHMSTRIPKQIIANAATIASFYQREPSEISYISSIMGGGNPSKIDAARNMLLKLKTNQVMLMSTVFRDPIVVRTRRQDKIITTSATARIEAAATVSSKRRSNPGPEHEAYLKVISDDLAMHGIKHKVLDGPNQPDIEAYIDNSKIAIEYETGMKNLSATRLMLERRTSSYKHIVVFVNDGSYQRYADGLSGMGLVLVPASSAKVAHSFVTGL